MSTSIDSDELIVVRPDRMTSGRATASTVAPAIHPMAVIHVVAPRRLRRRTRKASTGPTSSPSVAAMPMIPTRLHGLTGGMFAASAFRIAVTAGWLDSKADCANGLNIAACPVAPDQRRSLIRRAGRSSPTACRYTVLAASMLNVGARRCGSVATRPRRPAPKGPVASRPRSPSSGMCSVQPRALPRSVSERVRARTVKVSGAFSFTVTGGSKLHGRSLVTSVPGHVTVVASCTSSGRSSRPFHGVRQSEPASSATSRRLPPASTQSNRACLARGSALESESVVAITASTQSYVNQVRKSSSGRVGLIVTLRHGEPGSAFSEAGGCGSGCERVAAAKGTSPTSMRLSASLVGGGNESSTPEMRPSERRIGRSSLSMVTSTRSALALMLTGTSCGVTTPGVVDTFRRTTASCVESCTVRTEITALCDRTRLVSHTRTGRNPVLNPLSPGPTSIRTSRRSRGESSGGGIAGIGRGEGTDCRPTAGRAIIAASNAVTSRTKECRKATGFTGTPCGCR